MTSTGSDLRNRIQQKRETVNQQIDETMIPLESPVPAIGTPGSESGGRKRAYGFGLRPGRESAGRATEPYRLRASPRLYTNVVGTLGSAAAASSARRFHRARFPGERRPVASQTRNVSGGVSPIEQIWRALAQRAGAARLPASSRQRA